MAVVITGDLIESSKLAIDQRQQRINLLFEQLVTCLRQRWKNDSQLRGEIVQGDAFQIYTANDKDALRLAFIIRCFYRSQNAKQAKYRYDCRLSVAIGEIQSLDNSALAKSGGFVFELSGRAIKHISKTGPQIVFKSGQSAQEAAINMGLSLAELSIKGWRASQSKAILMKLVHSDTNQEWMAEHLGVSASAFSQRLNQAGWKAIETFLTYYEKPG